MARRQQIHKIYKLQRPRVILGAGSSYILAYDQYRRDQLNLLISPELEELFGDELVIYVKAYMDQQSNLHIVEKVEKPRGWR